MGKVLVGTIVGALLGWYIGSLPDYSSVRLSVDQGGVQTTVHLYSVLLALSTMLGTAAGGIIGAIAGRAASDPSSTPLPKWFRVALLAVFCGLVLLYVVSAVAFVFRSSSTTPRPDGDRQHERFRAPARKNPGE